MERNLHSVLGVNRFASQDTLKQAFRAGILRCHPDHNPRDPEAAERTRALVEAYQKLRDEKAIAAQRREARYSPVICSPDTACPQWLSRCVALVLFFALSVGLFYFSYATINNRRQVFRPMVNVVSLNAMDAFGDDNYYAKTDRAQVQTAGIQRQFGD
ncbi:MAG: DnaJ domain-containing protein [Armatimonadetes bacterium]|nr:DnaJ domain-containing protein [Armatimonadota bacterium]